MASSSHDADKENLCRTRIPIPKAPLPPLPKHLLVNTMMVRKQEVPKRRPLKTINEQSTSILQPGPNIVVPQKPNHPMKIDSKHLTTRQVSEDLNLDKRAKDKSTCIPMAGPSKIVTDKNASVITISDDESYLEDEDSQRHFVEHDKEKGAVLTAVTPNLNVNLEPNHVMNLTRGPKKPNNRELQGLSARQDTPDDKVKHRLNFNKHTTGRSTTPDFWKRSYMRSLYRDHTTRMFKYLLEKEVKPLQMPRISSITRAGVINWLMKFNGVDGDPAIVQAACWYFDSALGLSKVQEDQLQLVGAACFSIVQKLNGPYIPAMILVKHSNSAFTTDKLEDTEKAVMKTLKYPNQPIVPQDYITYLSRWCGSRNAGEIEVAATFLVMCGLLVDRVLCDEYPSVVAVAAVVNALLLLRKTELMPHLETCKIYKAAEKKAANLAYTCSILRRAVRTVASSSYQFKTPLDHYDVPPCRIANRVVTTATRAVIS